MTKSESLPPEITDELVEKMCAELRKTGVWVTHKEMRSALLILVKELKL